MPEIYGYTRLDSDCEIAKQTETFLFHEKTDRDNAMYEDYKAQFQAYTENNKDIDGEPLMDKDTFLKILQESKDINNSVFGLIGLKNSYVQFEPFAKTIN